MGERNSQSNSEAQGGRETRSGHKGGWLAIIPAIAVVALVVNGLDPAANRAKLFFPDASGSKLAAETRRLDLSGSLEERSQRVLEELILGPFGNSLQRLLPRETRLRAVLHREGQLHVAIEVPDLAALKTPFRLVKEAFEKSLASSVPGFGKLELYINGSLASR